VFRRTATALGRAGVRESDLNGIVDFSLWWVILHHAYQRWFADPAYLAREWARIEALVEAIASRCDGDGLLVPDPDAWVFIAWALEGELDLEQTIVPLQLLWHWALRAGAALAERRGERAVAGRWRGRADALGALLRERAWDEDARGWRLHAETAGATSRHANVLAVLADVASPEQHDALRAGLLDRSAAPMTNPQWMAFELTALARLGLAGELPERIAGYWGGMLDRGATTFWEEFDPASPEDDHAMYERPFGKSLCHAWSSGPAALLPGEVLGVRPLADGWERFVVEPTLGPLTWGSVVVPTPHGDITVEVEDERVFVSAPPGTTGSVLGRRVVGGEAVTVELPG
jgi:alpha-L-rhamnosidase